MSGCIFGKSNSETKNDYKNNTTTNITAQEEQKTESPIAESFKKPMDIL